MILGQNSEWKNLGFLSGFEPVMPSFSNKIAKTVIPDAKPTEPSCNNKLFATRVLSST